MLQSQSKQSASSGSMFQRYFLGYTSVKVPQKHGKGFRVERIYTDPYHAHQMSNEDWRKRKILIGLILAIVVAAYLLPSVARVHSNSVIYVVLPGCLALFSLIFTISSGVFYLNCPRLMTHWEFERSTKQLKRWAVVSAISLSLLAIANVLYILLSGGDQLINEVLCALGYIISAAGCFILYKIEKNTKYYEEVNDTKLPFFEKTEGDAAEW